MDYMAEIQRLMIQYRFKPNRRMSQNFMVQESVLDAIVSTAKLKSADRVLEIGSGTGFLTRKLLEHCPVIGIEKDDLLVEVLRAELSSEKLQIIHADFLDADLSALKYNKIVALPPYSISADIMYKIMTSGFETAFVVFQREFAEKLRAQPGFTQYNALSAITQYFCTVQLHQTIESGAFYPKPKGPSALVELQYTHPFGRIPNETQLVVLVKELFRYKNKRLSNALTLAKPFLHPQADLAKLKASAAFARLADQKIYLLEISDFVELAKSL